MERIETVNLAERLGRFTEHRRPKIKDLAH